MRPVRWTLPLVLIAAALPAAAQDRDTKVRNDRATFAETTAWIYNDLAAGRRAAEAAGKPLLVVLRCIPCEACQEFDDDVARRDPAIRDLLDQFVCVRIVQANTLDLAHFQNDFDLSFAAYLMAPDLTVYGRFGTRSARPEPEDITLAGLRRAMEGALELHRQGPAARPGLAGKQVTPSRFRTPRDYPTLAGKYGERIDYEGKTAQSCLHCHQVREAERLVHRTAGEPIPDAVLFPYPDPAVLGLKLDPTAAATVERVEPASVAARAGLQVGDQVTTLAGQPLLSIADVQWALHGTAGGATRVPARVRRGTETLDLTLDLPDGWRRRGDLSWRATTWDLRRMGLGGLWVEDLSDDRRRAAGLPADTMALRIKHIGEYGDHAVAKRAGILKDDVIVGYDGQSGRMTESEVLAHALQRRRPGDAVDLIVLRDGARRTVRITLQ